MDSRLRGNDKLPKRAKSGRVSEQSKNAASLGKIQ
jgi:hypothetical protein